MTVARLDIYLLLAIGLFCIGLYAVLGRRNALGVLMGVVLMLNAVILNLATFWTFWRSVEPASMGGQALAVSVYVVAVAEIVVGLALAITLRRTRSTVVLDDVDSLQG